MAVKLRLRRIGKKKQPIYKLVAADARSPRDGKFIEEIGLYFPQKSANLLQYDEEKAIKWLSVGAQPTETARSLISRQGTLLKMELRRKNTPEEKIQEEVEKFLANVNQRLEKKKTKKSNKAKKEKKEK